MGKAVMHKDTARQRKDLSLILQAAKRRREDQAIIITLEIRSGMMARVMIFLKTKTLIRNEGIPVHALKFRNILIIFIHRIANLAKKRDSAISRSPNGSI